MTQFFNITIAVCAAIGTTYTVLKLYQYVYYVIGLFKIPRYKETDDKRKYGICIAARNEEKVIENLLQSIDIQDYPKEKLTVFVVADNCTDKTAEIARNYAKKSGYKIVVYEHKNPNERTKGFALRYLFEQIKKDYEDGVKTFDGYFIFDADNVLASNYITKMNEAFVAGNDAVVSLRNSKNMTQNWISFSYAIHWLRTCLFESRGKKYLDLSCRVQGTGFVFASHFVENGWKYIDLTEDREFCTDVVVQGYKVGYCEEAKFYDEQPYKFKVAWRQRVRWAKGHLQSAVKYCPKLLKNVFQVNDTSFRSYDIFWLNFPRTIESGFRRVLKWICQIGLAIIAYNFWGGLWGIVKLAICDLIVYWFERVIQAIVVCVYYRKEIDKVNLFKLMFCLLMFPAFDYIGKWTYYVALFKKVEWKPIPHDIVVDVNKFK